MKHLRLFLTIVASLILSSQLALAQVGDYLASEMSRISKIENMNQKTESARSLFEDFFELQRGHLNLFIAISLGMDPSNPNYVNRYDYYSFKTFREFSDFYRSRAYVGIATSIDKKSQFLEDIAKRIRNHQFIRALAIDIINSTKSEISNSESLGLTLKSGLNKFYLRGASSDKGKLLPLFSDVVKFLINTSRKPQPGDYTKKVLTPIFEALMEIESDELARQAISVLQNDIWAQFSPQIIEEFLERENVDLNKSIIFRVLSKESWEKGYPEYEQLIESLVDSEAYDEHLVRYVFTQGRLKNRADLVLKIFARNQVNDEFIFGLNDLSKNSPSEANLVPTIISGLIDRTDTTEVKSNIYEILYSMSERTDFWLNYQGSFFKVANKAIDLDNPEYKASPIELSTYWVIKALALQPELARSPEGGRLIRRINRMKFLTSNMDEFDDLVDIALNSAQFQPASCIEWFMRSQY